MEAIIFFLIFFLAKDHPSVRITSLERPGLEV